MTKTINVAIKMTGFTKFDQILELLQRIMLLIGVLQRIPSIRRVYDVHINSAVIQKVDLNFQKSAIKSSKSS